MSPPLVTAIYVPGDRPERFDKAVATGAQLVILDLEDAVAASRKPAAREAVATWLRAGHPQSTSFTVRINAGDDNDLTLLTSLAGADVPFGVLVPKVQSGADIDPVAAAAPGRPVTALIETARGVENLTAIGAHRSLVGLGLGEADLASDIGTNDPSVLDYARNRLLFAARANGLARPMMSVYPAIADLDGLRRDTEQGRRRGFVGRTAIHPRQVPVIRAAFVPLAAEVAWAHEVIDALATGGVTRLASGDMVDPAMLGRAETIVALTRTTT